MGKNKFNQIEGFKVFALMSIASLSIQGVRLEASEMTDYPIGILNIVKDFTAPLEDTVECKGGGLIPEINCHLNKFGVNGIGTFHGKEEAGHYFTIRVSADTSQGYDFYVEAWVDYRNQDGTLNDKFMNYWFSEGGNRGLIEIYPEYPGRGLNPSESEDGVLKVTWNSTIPSHQTMSVSVLRVNMNDEITWENRRAAFKFDVVVDSINNTAELAGTANVSFDGKEHQGFSLNMKRDSVRTLVLGSRYSAVGSEILEKGKAQCVLNESKAVLEQAADLSGLGGGLCSALVSDLTLAPSAPTQKVLDLLGDESEQSFSLNLSDKF